MCALRDEGGLIQWGSMREAASYLPAIFSFFPPGGVAATLIGTLLANRQQRRFQQFMLEVDQRLRKLEDDDIDQDFLKTDDCDALFADCALRASRVVRSEKLRTFAAIMVASARKGRPGVSIIDHFLSVVDELLPEHVQILRALDTYTAKWTIEHPTPEARSDALNGGDTAATETAHLGPPDLAGLVSGISQNRLIAFNAGLVARGLCLDAYVGREDYRPGYIEITDFGRDLVAFLKAGFEEEVT